MTVYELKTMQKCEIDKNTVVALGTFDGCHLGHASVLQNAFYMAKSMGASTLAYTFASVPTKGTEAVEAIFTLDEKIKAIKRFGFDYIAIESFDEVKDMDPDVFMSNVLIDKLRAVGASCGFNYRFGKNASKSAMDLKEYFEKSGRSVQISGEIVLNNKLVSSTMIRGLIKNGGIEEAHSYMNPYSIYAMVEKGKGLGKQFGFATINQKIPEGKIVPKSGVYITECELGEDVYPSVTNVGYRPTTDGVGAELNVETHILGYSTNLYYSSVRVNFYKYLREEKKFSSIENLKEQIDKDIEETKKYFGIIKGL